MTLRSAPRSRILHAILCNDRRRIAACDPFDIATPTMVSAQNGKIDLINVVNWVAISSRVKFHDGCQSSTMSVRYRFSLI
jgi:hypothetical protein